MRISKATTTIEAVTPNLEQVIEAAGRTCYKSEDRITEDSAFAFIRKMRDQYKHHSVLEHGAITVRFICDRGVSHELVRHRLASFSQESTRYCNYGKEKFGREITVIEPCFFANTPPDNDPPGRGAYWVWLNACKAAETAYFQMLDEGCTPQEARSVLPNSLKTEIVITANPREWLHIFAMRTTKEAHPQMREVMLPLQEEFARRWPALFGV